MHFEIQKFKAAFIFGLVALITSVPVIQLISELIRPQITINSFQIMFYSPLLVGVAAIIIFYILSISAHNFWVHYWPLFGIAVALITYCFYFIGFYIWAWSSNNDELFQIVKGFSASALIVFGWAPILGGLLAGWIANNLVNKNA